MKTEEVVSIVDAAQLVRQIVIDTGCDWTQAAAKVLAETTLASDDMSMLAARGLANYCQKTLNRPKIIHEETADNSATVNELLQPFAGLLSLSRIFRIGDTNKRLIDADRDELPLLIEDLKSKRDGFTASIKFMADLLAECERSKCHPRELPRKTLAMFDRAAPW